MLSGLDPFHDQAAAAHAQGWYALFPLANATVNANIIGWTALVGGTLFEAGAYCMVVEAVNRGNAVRFGYEVGLPASGQALRFASFPCGAGSARAQGGVQADGGARACMLQVRNLLESGLTRFYMVKDGGHYSLGPPEAGKVSPSSMRG